jgi:integrase
MEGGSMLVKLRIRTVKVRKANSHLLKGDDKFISGVVTYSVTGYSGRRRFVLALGTDSSKVASGLLGKINEVVAAGPNCPTWLELAERLPAYTFEFIARECGYVKPAQLKSIPVARASWADLRANYIADLDRKILDETFTESSKTNYLQTLFAFDRFVEEQGFTSLDQITEDVIKDKFKPWRKKSILSRKNSGKKANRLSFDLTVLRAAFNFQGDEKRVRRNAWLEAGFRIVENPVPSMKKDKKPGANPEEETKPFSDEELARIRSAAALRTYQDSVGRDYQLPHGTDALAVELLLRTGLRRCDAATLQWKAIRFDKGTGGMIQVSAKKNGEPILLPIHKHLGPLLRAEKVRQNPAETDAVLRNPLTGRMYDRDGKGLYRRLNELGNRLGIVEVRPHRFRCTFAVNALRRGASIVQIAAWLGDKPETVSAHYLPTSEAMSEETRKLLDSDDAGFDVALPAEAVPEIGRGRKANVA